MSLWRGEIHSLSCEDGNGRLPLQHMPPLVWWRVYGCELWYFGRD
ncbi:hypothetical protein CEV32_0181 [Brucella rhizosphaerae]|uniref:Uncharacterized protein n=1 Tax=Brucella rhizosphaerae TaxID=571254 RepID=A0A256FH81_9HYPH|nr:hypothetical protein CEV32_0181 [Brucella rhizosphaerae]